MENLKSIFEETSFYFDKKLLEFGPTHKALDWNNKNSQEIRLNQVLKIIDKNKYFTINDLGCGYGEAVHLLKNKYINYKYTGYDISGEMILEAQKIFADDCINAQFIHLKSYAEVKNADYTIASGIFNLKFDWIL